MSTTEWQRLLAVIGIIAILNIWIGYEISTFQIHNPTNIIFQRNNTKESHQSTKNLIKQNSHCLNHIYDAIFVISIPIRHETLSITSAQLFSENINFILWKGHSADNPHSVESWNIYRNNWKHVPDHWGNSAYKQLNIFLLRQTDIDIIHYSLKKNFSKILILEDDILLADTYWFQLFCKIEPNLPEWYILNLGINNILYDKDNFNQSNFFQHKNVSNFENSKMKYYQTPGRAYGTFAISFSYKIYQIILDVYDMDSKPGMRSDFPLDSYPEILPYYNDKFLSINPTLFLPDVTTSILRDGGETSMNEYIKTHTSDNDNSRFKQYWKLRFSDKYNSLVFENSPSQIYLQNNRLAHSNCSTVNVFPNYKVEQVFWEANDLLNHSTNNTYSLMGGTLLQMYRDCGLRMDFTDIDFGAPVQYLYAVKIAFQNSANFTLLYIFGKENQTGYELSFLHVTGIKVDVASVNNVNGMVFESLWIDNILHCCIVPNHTSFGHILRVRNYTFSVIGPIDAIEQYLENLYGPNWAIPIPSTKWNWKNERCIPYIDNGGTFNNNMCNNNTKFNINDILIYDIEIDIVLAWSGPSNMLMHQEHNYDISRDRDNEELKYLLHSIAKNVNWFNNIYILVNNIVPKPDYIPSKITERVHIINRCNLMPKGTCPTRNSLAVYHYVHNIPNLSEYFIMAEDDIFIGRKVGMNHFFTCVNNQYLPYVWRTKGTYGYFNNKQFHPIYINNKINSLFNKLPKSTAPSPHLWYPMLKSVASLLYNEYLEYFQFVASHKYGRWSSETNGSNDAINSQEECYYGVAEWYLLHINKGIYKNILTNEMRYIWWDEMWHPNMKDKYEVYKSRNNQLPIFLNTNDQVLNNKTKETQQRREFHRIMSDIFPLSKIKFHLKQAVPNILSYVGDRICISEEYEFIWIKITKTGGQSLIKLLKYQLCNITFTGPNDDVYKNCANLSSFQCVYWDNDNATSEINKYIISKWEKYFVFAVIRDPLSRLMSMRSYCEINDDLFCSKQFKPTYCGICSIEHCARYSQLIMDENTGKFYVNFIGKMETYQQDLNIILDRIYSKNSKFPKNVLIPFINKSDKKRIKYNCVNETVQMVRKFYEEDVRIYDNQ